MSSFVCRRAFNGPDHDSSEGGVEWRVRQSVIVGKSAGMGQGQIATGFGLFDDRRFGLD